MSVKFLSRLSILSLLLYAGSREAITSAMDIVDETTHEKVYESGEAGSDDLSDQMASAIDEDQEPVPDGGNEPAVSVADENKEGDYVEESDTPDGRHIRKEVHQGPGFKTVRISTSGGSGPVLGGGGPSIMQAMMQDMMS